MTPEDRNKPGVLIRRGKHCNFGDCKEEPAFIIFLSPGTLKPESISAFFPCVYHINTAAAHAIEVIVGASKIAENALQEALQKEALRN